MPTWVCKACGTQYPPSEEPPGACPICEDPRQYIPHDEGQVWLRWEELLASHRADVRDDHGILGVGCTPDFAIGQRALFVKSAAGNILWDCISLIDSDTVARIQALGGISTIAISHPHYYASMVEWSRAFGGAPIYLHEDDRQWVQHPDPCIRFWQGETHTLSGAFTLIRIGGHFAG